MMDTCSLLQENAKAILLPGLGQVGHPWQQELKRQIVHHLPLPPPPPQPLIEYSQHTDVQQRVLNRFTIANTY